MEVDEIQRRITYQDEDDEDGERVGVGGSGGAGGGGGGGEESGSGRLRAWHTSRIFRVSRASGGKDRHSKVLTAKGLRDRRVRLSVSTAIQFYDLQDRLGYDQPSKAVEWLIKAAADSISELPSLDSRFPHPPDTPRTQQQLSDDTSAEAERERERERHGFELEDTYHQHHQMITNAKSSSTSETSKGSSSVLSRSRSEIRVKARERARERAAKDKQKEDDESPHGHQHHQLGPHAHQHNSQNSSFTELLTGGVCANNHNSSPANASRHFPSSSTSMDYFTSAGLFGSRNQFSSGGFSGQATHFGMAPPFSIAGGGGSGGGDHHTQQQQQQPHHPELQHFAFLPENFIQQEAAGGGSDYNLNFSISSGLAAYNRGTLQSNSPSSPLPSHLQRFSSQADHGSNIPFFMGNAATAGAASASPPSAEAHQQHQHFQAAFDGRLHLCYGDADRHSDLKGKRKT